MEDLETKFERAMERGVAHDAFMAMLRYRVEFELKGKSLDVIRKNLTILMNRALRENKKEDNNGDG